MTIAVACPTIADAEGWMRLLSLAGELAGIREIEDDTVVVATTIMVA